jgi:hypothetical protein
MTTDSDTNVGANPWAWAVALVIGSVSAFFGAFGLAAILRSVNAWPETLDSTVRWDLAALYGLMALLGLVAVLASVRLAFGSWPRFNGRQLVLPIVGTVIAIAQELALHEWARIRIGGYEFDVFMPTAVLAWASLAVAVGTFAAHIAPRRAVFVPLLGTSAMAGSVLIITLMNVPGLVDGIHAESWPLAILIGVSAIYAVGCVAISTRKVWAQ